MKIQLLPIDQIKPYEHNAKKHPDDQITRVAASIQKFGFDQPIVVDKHFVIIKGHGRRLGAIKLGLKEVPVLVREDLTELQVRAARLADNRVALSGIDTATLKKEIADLNKELLDIYDQKEMDFLVADLGVQNVDAFVADVEIAVLEQEDATKILSDENALKRVPLAKVFGFKDVQRSSEIYFTRFMARIESDSGLIGEAALVHFLKSLVPA